MFPVVVIVFPIIRLISFFVNIEEIEAKSVVLNPLTFLPALNNLSPLAEITLPNPPCLNPLILLLITLIIFPPILIFPLVINLDDLIVPFPIPAKICFFIIRGLPVSKLIACIPDFPKVNVVPVFPFIIVTPLANPTLFDPTLKTISVIILFPFSF